MTAAVWARCEAIVTKASTMPITPTMTLTPLVKASPPPSCEVWISTSAMDVFRRKGIAGHFFEGRQHDMAEGAQIRARRDHVRNLNDRHAGSMGRAHAVLGVLDRQTGPGINAQVSGRLQVNLRI